MGQRFFSGGMQGVDHYVTQNITHSNYTERFIRTLKVYRYFDHFKTYKFTDVLQDIVRNYNGRPHRSLDGLSPRDINKTNEAMTWKKLYIDVLKPSVFKKKAHISIRDSMLDCRESSTLFSETTNKKGRRKFLLISKRFLR